MKILLPVILLVVVGVGTVFANVYRPRTLEEKVNDAVLIVLGKATIVGDKKPFSTNDIIPQYERTLNIYVKQVIWPPSYTNKNEPIRFKYFISENWPKSWWDYTNTPGILFLMKNSNPERGQWDRLPLFDDWMEPITNTLAVLLSVEKNKGALTLTNSIRIPEVSYPNTTAYDDSQKLRLLYLSSFRDGFHDALCGTNKLLMFAPTNQEDKIKVLGFADGQLAGTSAKEKWMKALNNFMNQ